MWKKVLVVTLWAAFLFETAFALAGFFAQSWLLVQFKMGNTPDTQFMAFIISWFLLLISLFAGLCLRWVSRGQAAGWTLSYLLGGWWVAIGLAIYIVYQKPDNLILDTAKGALIILAAWKSQPRRAR